MQKKLFISHIAIVLILYCCGMAFAQLSSYQGIINPYERYGGLGGSFGGVIIAEPDAVPSPLDNPAGISCLQKPQVYVGTTTRISKYVFGHSESFLNKTQSWDSEFAPTQIAVSYPLPLLHREAALALSLANVPAPEIETGYTIKEDDMPEIHHDRSGNVGNVTIGYSIKVTPSYSIGLSYTRWLGSWTWEDSGITQQMLYGKGKFQYDGQSINLGMSKQIQRFSIGALVQSPLTLMKAREITITEWEITNNIELEQKVNGAAAIAVSYRLSDEVKLGIGYRYQDKLKMVIKNYYFSDIEETIETHKLTVAGELTFKWEKVEIPFFLAWQRAWSNVEDGYAIGYLITDSDNNEQMVQNTIQYGVNWEFKSFGVHLAGLWQQYQNGIQIRNSQIPPYS